MINLNNIFHLFTSEDNLDGIDTSTTLIDFKNTPIYWIGMYKKLILNHITLNKKITEIIGKSNKEFDLRDIEEAGSHLAYNKAWGYIKKIDIKNKEHTKGIESYRDKYLDKTLKLGINFFVETEEYEKCAHLQKILNYFSR